MRVVEQKMVCAVRRHKNMRGRNTEVWSSETQTEVLLFGNRIAVFDWVAMSLSITNCGWATKTTMSRLNSLLHEFTSGEGIYKRGDKWHFVGGNVFEPCTLKIGPPIPPLTLEMLEGFFSKA
jgi:hypothetical protein